MNFCKNKNKQTNKQQKTLQKPSFPTQFDTYETEIEICLLEVKYRSDCLNMQKTLLNKVSIKIPRNLPEEVNGRAEF